MYMNGFRCKVTGSTSNTAIMKPEVPIRCTGDISKCNQGAQQPLYWFQAERNNMFNGQYDPPYYLDEWGFTDGAQNGIFGKRDDNPNTSTSTSTTSTTTDNKPPSTPNPTTVDNKPSSTPVDPPKESSSYGGYDGGSPTPSPSPSPSPPVKNDAAAPSPSPTKPADYSSPDPKGDGKGNSKTNTANGHLPSPSGKPRCKKRKDKKRQVLASRHLKNKRHNAHSH